MPLTGRRSAAAAARAAPRAASVHSGPASPRFGFAGLGWIGAQRMQVLAESGLGQVAAVCEPDRERLHAACGHLRRRPVHCDNFAALLRQDLEGVVIATPNALHESQAAAAMMQGIPVFCQKPLALTARSTRELVALARARGLPLGVDWSYRYLAGVAELKERIAKGELGRITAVELCFHNAWGPDAAWYYDLSRSGGGCLLDLGCHLLDLCHWLVGAREPRDVRARCFRSGTRLPLPVAELEDLVTADIEYASGEHVRLSCSWRASTGCGAIIGCRIFGTEGGAAIRNLQGSFYDFEVSLNHGAESQLLGSPPDAWPGRALLDWAARVRAANGCGDLEPLTATAEVIDRIYGRGG